MQPAVTAKLLTDREGAENFRPMLTSEIKTKLAIRISVTQRLSLTTTDPLPTSITAAARAPSPDPSARGPPPPDHLSAISYVGTRAPGAGGRNPLTRLRRTAGWSHDGERQDHRPSREKEESVDAHLPSRMARLKSAGRKHYDATCPRGRWSTDNSFEKTLHRSPQS